MCNASAAMPGLVVQASTTTLVLDAEHEPVDTVEPAAVPFSLRQLVLLAAMNSRFVSAVPCQEETLEQVTGGRPS